MAIQPGSAVDLLAILAILDTLLRETQIPYYNQEGKETPGTSLNSICVCDGEMNCDNPRTQ